MFISTQVLSPCYATHEYQITNSKIQYSSNPIEPQATSPSPTTQSTFQSDEIAHNFKDFQYSP